MARRGLFSRITDFFERIGDALSDFFGEPEEEEPRRAPPSPPPGGPPRPPGPDFFESDETRIWRSVAVGRDRLDMDTMREWLDLYRNSVDPLEMDSQEFLQFWDEFLRAYYLSSGERGHISRQIFHRNIGVSQRDWEMDWQEWREIKRGTP